MNTMVFYGSMLLAFPTILISAHDHHEHHSHPKYKFDYGVKDTHTGDIKQQWEERDGDKVKGAYELKEADGTKRAVEYSADKGGFHALVKRIGHADHPAPKHHDHHSHHEHGHASSYANVHLHH